VLAVESLLDIKMAIARASMLKKMRALVALVVVAVLQLCSPCSVSLRLSETESAINPSLNLNVVVESEAAVLKDITRI